MGEELFGRMLPLQRALSCRCETRGMKGKGTGGFTVLSCFVAHVATRTALVSFPRISSTYGVP